MSEEVPKRRVQLTPEEAVLRETLRLTKRNAAQRGHEFALSDEQAFELFRQPCIYCGCFDIRCRGNRCVPCNGIDRFENSKPYVLSNCVSSCEKCNAGKTDMTVDEWYRWRLSVAKYIDTSQKRLNKLSEGYRGE